MVSQNQLISSAVLAASQSLPSDAPQETWSRQIIGPEGANWRPTWCTLGRRSKLTFPRARGAVQGEETRGQGDALNSQIF